MPITKITINFPTYLRYGEGNRKMDTCYMELFKVAKDIETCGRMISFLGSNQTEDVKTVSRQFFPEHSFQTFKLSKRRRIYTVSFLKIEESAY